MIIRRSDISPKRTVNVGGFMLIDKYSEIPHFGDIFDFNIVQVIKDKRGKEVPIIRLVPHEHKFDSCKCECGVEQHTLINRNKICSTAHYHYDLYKCECGWEAKEVNPQPHIPNKDFVCEICGRDLVETMPIEYVITQVNSIGDVSKAILTYKEISKLEKQELSYSLKKNAHEKALAIFKQGYCYDRCESYRFYFDDQLQIVEVYSNSGGESKWIDDHYSSFVDDPTYYSKKPISRLNDPDAMAKFDEIKSKLLKAKADILPEEKYNDVVKELNNIRTILKQKNKEFSPFYRAERFIRCSALIRAYEHIFKEDYYFSVIEVLRVVDFINKNCYIKI